MNLHDGEMPETIYAVSRESSRAFLRKATKPDRDEPIDPLFEKHWQSPRRATGADATRPTHQVVPLDGHQIVIERKDQNVFAIQQKADLRARQG